MKENSSAAPGRPSKLTPDRVTRLAEALRAGHTRATAAALAGIGESTLYAWLQAANQPDAAPEFVDFLDAVKKAEVEGEDALVGIIRAAADKSWQAAAWILERRRPDSWGKRLKTEVVATPPPSAERKSAIERDMAEAEEKARLTMEVTQWARRGIPFEAWPAHVKAEALNPG